MKMVWINTIVNATRTTHEIYIRKIEKDVGDEPVNHDHLTLNAHHGVTVTVHGATPHPARQERATHHVRLDVVQPLLGHVFQGGMDVYQRPTFVHMCIV